MPTISVSVHSSNNAMLSCACFHTFLLFLLKGEICQGPSKFHLMELINYTSHLRLADAMKVKETYDFMKVEVDLEVSTLK